MFILQCMDPQGSSTDPQGSSMDSSSPVDSNSTDPNVYPPANMNITLLHAGKPNVQKIPTDATVGFVRELLHERFTIPLERVELHINLLPLPLQPLPDEMNMLDVYPFLEEKHEFRLYRKIEIWIKIVSSGERYGLLVNENLKAAFLYAILTSNGIDIKHKLLYYPENQPVDDSLLLWGCGIREGSELYLK
ncbi:uncharacterized protein LOC115989500 isoform X1 [Quercus lobata]|uniref:uncharacterized protein LOC115989500 isoform X1 n=1 Tax=Quercus lobata TaxID=97700 RepID=UPI00124928B8|nr:uncharacterized protein LOC115989500 isoform X1 [Quercus lobata]